MRASSLSDLPQRGKMRQGRGSIAPLDSVRMGNFRVIHRDIGFLMPPSVDESLPQRHLARFDASGERRIRAVPSPPPQDPTQLEAVDHRLKTPEENKRYVLRKQTSKPIFGIINSALGFRKFLLRGLDQVRGEWPIVTMAHNMKPIFALAGAN